MSDTPERAAGPASGAPSAPASGPASETSLEEARLRQQAIGSKLRQMFDQVVNEPVPDEFLEILRRADRGSASGGRD